MKIHYEYAPEPTRLQDFADEYGLELVVKQSYPDIGTDCEFLAGFRHVSISRHGGFRYKKVVGYGETPFEAISAYAKLIGGSVALIQEPNKAVSVGDDGKIVNGTEIQVPYLIYEEES